MRVKPAINARKYKQFKSIESNFEKKSIIVSEKKKKTIIVSEKKKKYSIDFYLNML